RQPAGSFWSAQVQWRRGENAGSTAVAARGRGSPSRWPWAEPSLARQWVALPAEVPAVERAVERAGQPWQLQGWGARSVSPLPRPAASLLSTTSRPAPRAAPPGAPEASGSGAPAAAERPRSCPGQRAPGAGPSSVGPRPGAVSCAPAAAPRPGSGRSTRLAPRGLARWTRSIRAEPRGRTQLRSRTPCPVGCVKSSGASCLPRRPACSRDSAH
ncbi:MAG: hypothetical protein RL685_6112, partial [Pseudomonadota bacterium]